MGCRKKVGLLWQRRWWVGRAVGEFNQGVTVTDGSELDLLHSVGHGEAPKSCAVTAWVVGMQSVRSLNPHGNVSPSSHLRENF